MSKDGKKEFSSNEALSNELFLSPIWPKGDIYELFGDSERMVACRMKSSCWYMILTRLKRLILKYLIRQTYVQSRQRQRVLATSLLPSHWK